MFGNPDELKGRFYPQFLNAEGLAQLELVRERYLELAEALDQLIRSGREKSVALEELQASSMWAIKAVCVDQHYWRTDETGKDESPAMRPDAIVKKRKKIVGFRSEEEGVWTLVYSDSSDGGTIRQGLLEELLEAFRASKS